MATADSLKALRNTLKGLGEAKAQLEHIKRLLPRANGEDLATLRDCKEKVDGFVEVFKTDYDACLKDGWRSGLARAIAAQRLSWSIPTFKLVAQIDKALTRAGVTCALELGAGHAMFGAMLRAVSDVPIILTDDYPKAAAKAFGSRCHLALTDVERFSGEEAIRKFDGEYDCLVFIWPPCNDDWAADCLKAAMPPFVLYWGEGEGGCTGTAEFHDILYKDYKLVEIDGELCDWEPVHLPLGMFEAHAHDFVKLYERK